MSSYYFESPNVETKESVELAYSRRSKPFDLESVKQEYSELTDIVNTVYYHSGESIKRRSKREMIRNQAQIRLENLHQDILEDAIYDFNRIDEIVKIATEEIRQHFFTIKDSVRDIYKKNYGMFKTIRDEDIKQEIELQTNLVLITQQMDIIYKIFVREYLYETIQNLTNRITFLREDVLGETIRRMGLGDRSTPLVQILTTNTMMFLRENVPSGYRLLEQIFEEHFDKYYKYFHIRFFSEFLSFEPKMRDIVDLVFPVPSYEEMFFRWFEQPEVFTRQDLPVNRLPKEFEQDRQVFAIARDTEPAILQYLIKPKTEEDIQWEQERQEQWNEQIRMISIIETQVNQQQSLVHYSARRDWNRDLKRSSYF